jgi:hypothetical protein
MHHERAEQLIGRLSNSSERAESILKENVIETKRIL